MSRTKKIKRDRSRSTDTSRSKKISRFDSTVLRNTTDESEDGDNFVERDNKP